MFLEYRIENNEQNFTDTALHYHIQKACLLHAVSTEKRTRCVEHEVPPYDFRKFVDLKIHHLRLGRYLI